MTASMEAIISVRDQAIADDSPYIVHLAIAHNSRNYTIDSRGGPIIWDDDNLLLYAVICNTDFPSCMLFPVTIRSIAYDAISLIEIFYEN